MINEGATSVDGGRGQAQVEDESRGKRNGRTISVLTSSEDELVTPISILLVCVAALLGTAVFAVLLVHSSRSTPVVYGAGLVFSAIAFFTALAYLAAGLPSAEAPMLTLPFGLPWLGSHFRLDTLAASS